MAMKQGPQHRQKHRDVRRYLHDEDDAWQRGADNTNKKKAAIPKTANPSG
jgi:hypothetical protein